MKKTAVFTILLTLVMASFAFSATKAAAPASVEKGTSAIAVQGGLLSPMGDLNSSDAGKVKLKMGYDFGASYDYYLTPMFALGGEFTYGQMVLKDNTDFKAKFMNYGLVGKYIIPAGGPVVPYIRVGLGMYNRKFEGTDAGVTVSVSDSKFGVNGGVGVDYKVNSNFGIGVNGLYHFPSGKFEEGGASLNTNWISFNGVVTYYLPSMKK